MKCLFPDYLPTIVECPYMWECTTCPNFRPIRDLVVGCFTDTLATELSATHRLEGADPHE